MRQWLEASTQLEEGEAPEVGGQQGLVRRLVDGHSFFSPWAASVYSRWEVEEDWCLSVLRSYQAEHGPDFPWSVGKEDLHGGV